MSKKGLEPSRLYHTNLNRARLPIPPLRHYKNYFIFFRIFIDILHFMRYYNINKTKGGRTTRNLILTPKSKKVRGMDQKEHNLKPE